LTRADLSGADLAGAKGISAEEIRQQTDKVEDTIMPESKPRSQLLDEAWEALKKGLNYNTAVDRAQEYIDRSKRQALRTQKKLEDKDIPEPPTGSVDEETKQQILARNYLNGTATCYWIKGRALEALDQAGEAKAAYSEAQRFTHARTWNEEEKTFWSPAKASRA
jgi:hypothetical protein